MEISRITVSVLPFAAAKDLLILIALSFAFSNLNGSLLFKNAGILFCRPPTCETAGIRYSRDFKIHTSFTRFCA